MQKIPNAAENVQKSGECPVSKIEAPLTKNNS